MPLKLNHIHLKGADPRRTARWYVDNLGGVIEQEITNPQGATTVRVDLGGTRLNISSPLPGQRLPGGSAGLHLGLEHFGVESDDLAALMQRLQAGGVKVLEPVRELAGGTRIAFIEAPDDVRIEVMQVAG